ncbi:hypothetical protein HGO38_23260 [Rhizobium sp. CG5]|uniref:hypothetical protein n=1 Tax=Rhizobium sp. CG5 TaxID=2726076 RepID=UPI002034426B|nr:hypothetical protein [Rhizobium sp. CG5]MCM2476387.1 hypothetical protein [Rhizobium sp. CG5]
MKFGTNKLYIESYTKCRNCGALIYEAKMADAIKRGGEIFCEAWCADWAQARAERKADAGTAA